MSIYSTNRVVNESVMTMTPNRKYRNTEDFGRILYECEVNDMAIFEAVCAFDMHQAVCIQEGTLLRSEIDALQEEAISSIKDKIVSTLKEFGRKIKSLFDAAIAQLSKLLVNVAVPYVKLNRKKLEEFDGSVDVTYKDVDIDVDNISKVLTTLGTGGGTSSDTYEEDVLRDLLGNNYKSDITFKNLNKDGIKAVTKEEKTTITSYDDIKPHVYNIMTYKSGLKVLAKVKQTSLATINYLITATKRLTDVDSDDLKKIKQSRTAVNSISNFAIKLMKVQHSGSFMVIRSVLAGIKKGGDDETPEPEKTEEKVEDMSEATFIKYLDLLEAADEVNDALNTAPTEDEMDDAEEIVKTIELDPNEKLIITPSDECDD